MLAKADTRISEPAASTRSGANDVTGGSGPRHAAAGAVAGIGTSAHEDARPSCRAAPQTGACARAVVVALGVSVAVVDAVTDAVCDSDADADADAEPHAESDGEPVADADAEDDWAVPVRDTAAAASTRRWARIAVARTV